MSGLVKARACAVACCVPFLLLVACSSSSSGGEAGSGGDGGVSEPVSVFDSATSLAAAIQEGELSASELLLLYLEQIDALNPALNAIVASDIEGARARAREADEALERGERWGPLHGVPCTIKDTINVAGLPTTIGSPEYEDFVPEENATTVQRLIDAGAIVFGKTPPLTMEPNKGETYVGPKGAQQPQG